MDIHAHVMERVAAILRADASLAGVPVVTQNEQELKDLIEQENGSVGGVVAVVTVDEIEKLHANPTAWAVTFSVAVTEFVPVNREDPGYRTALDVAVAAGNAVDESGYGHFDRIRHTTPGDGILNAVAECSGTFVETED